MATTKKTKKKKVTGEELGKLLFNIHEHIVHKDETDDIIYYEKDIIKLFVKLGLPKPIFAEDVKVKSGLKKSQLTKKQKVLRTLASEL